MDKNAHETLTVAELGVVDYDDALAMQTAMLAARMMPLLAGRWRSVR